MPNNKYLQGTAYERQRRTYWQKQGCEVLRSGGSRGKYDLTVIHPGGKVRLVQCKRASSASHAARMRDQFELHPPMPPSKHYIQAMEVYVPKVGTLTAEVGGITEVPYGPMYPVI